MDSIVYNLFKHDLDEYVKNSEMDAEVAKRIVDDLISLDTDKALSAKQGKKLKDSIDAIVASGGGDMLSVDYDEDRDGIIDRAKADKYGNDITTTYVHENNRVGMRYEVDNIEQGEIFNDYENNEAKGLNAHAEGIGTIANADGSHSQGKYNIEDTEKKYIHIVGNGKSETERSNAHTVDYNGNAWFAGDVTVGSDGDKLSTEKTVDKKISVVDKKIDDEIATHKHSADDIGSGVIDILHGGTGATTASEALANLGGIRAEYTYVLWDYYASEASVTFNITPTILFIHTSGGKGGYIGIGNCFCSIYDDTSMGHIFRQGNTVTLSTENWSFTRGTELLIYAIDLGGA